MDIYLERVEVRKIVFDRNALPEGDTELKVEVANNASVSEDKKKCLRKMILKIYTDKEGEENLFIEMEVYGYFSIKSLSKDLDEVNAITGEKLFPYLQSYVATITAISGVPALIIPGP